MTNRLWKFRIAAAAGLVGTLFVSAIYGRLRAQPIETAAAYQSVEDYMAPGGRFRAVVEFLPPNHGGIESIVKILDRRGLVIGYRDYASADGGHGFAVQYARWTPNGQFFVYVLESSGGHSPWHDPTHFFSVRLDTFYGLDDFVLGEAITSPTFKLRAPATVIVEGRGGSPGEGTIAVDLNRLVKKLTKGDDRSETDDN